MSSEHRTLSVLLLVNHVDELLEKSLSSAAWANEVVIGWTGEHDPSSTDKERIALILPTARIVRLPGVVTDFAAKRNQLQAHATSDWLFWLDSDEVICTESISTITSILGQEDVHGVYVRRQDIFAGRALKWGEVHNVEILRMYRRDFGSFIRPVHEVAVVEGEVIHSGITIEHYAHSSIKTFLAKVIGYAQIEAELRRAKGKRTSAVELIVWPIGKFLHNMVFRLAFLDGWQGLTYAVVMSIHSLAVRAMLMEKWQTPPK